MGVFFDNMTWGLVNLRWCFFWFFFLIKEPKIKVFAAEKGG